jgi:hypothetical protein
MYRPVAVPNTKVTNTMSEKSVLLGFTFRPVKK